ncbi:MAG: ATP-binding cassette domain-containing protein [Anaerolineaceae bacterium]|nr:ATP-binding cassette domain-containing protein [Anaerolineaceae bacterium]
MIDLQNVSFGYGRGKRIFEGFSWSAKRGEAWVVLGSSGCGKSTLLYLLAGLVHPEEGKVRVGDELLERPRPRTGLILQDYGLLPWATVQDNIALGLRVRQFYGPDGRHAPRDEKTPQINEKVEEWLEQLGLQEVAASYPGQISGGQRQRAAIGRTLALNPDLLLMDEPFASLDAPTREGLQRLTLRLNEESGLTTVVVTHSIEEAALLGRRVLVLGLPPNRTARVVKNLKEEQNAQDRAGLVERLRGMLESRE